MVTTRGFKRKIEEAATANGQQQTLCLTLTGFPSNLPHQHISCPRLTKRIKMCEKLADLVLKVDAAQNPVNKPYEFTPCATLKLQSKAVSSCPTTIPEPQVEKPPLQVLPLEKSRSLATSGRYPLRHVKHVPCRRNRSTAAIGAIKKERNDDMVADGTYLGNALSASPHDLEMQALLLEPVNDKSMSDEHILLHEALMPIAEEGLNSPSEADSNARQATSLNLSDMAALDDDCSSFNSETSDPVVTVGGYRVKENLAPILRDILSKYGDIAAHCDKKSVVHRSWLVENVCDIVLKLQTAEFVYLTPVEVDNLRVFVQDIESDNVEVGWLLLRLDEIFEAKKLLKESSKVKLNKNQIHQLIKKKEEEIKVYKGEIKVYEEEICKRQEKIAIAMQELEVRRAEGRDMDEILSYTKAQVKRFHFG